VARAGTLDNMDWAEPVGNIWSDSKAAWVKIEPELVNFLGQAVDRTRYWTPGPATIRAEEPENPAAAIARRLDPRETVSACLPIVF
jgi:hypothetical protein